jgi:excisionase family DNA binding protein
MGDAAEKLPPPAPEWLTVEEVAKILRIGRKQAYAAVNNGEIPGVRRIGKTIRVKRKALEQMGDGT